MSEPEMQPLVEFLGENKPGLTVCDFVRIGHINEVANGNPHLCVYKHKDTGRFLYLTTTGQPYQCKLNRDGRRLKYEYRTMSREEALEVLHV